jgi:hypothetical protein
MSRGFYVYLLGVEIQTASVLRHVSKEKMCEAMNGKRFGRSPMCSRLRIGV